MRGLGTVCAVRVSEDSLICVKISGVAGHAFVDKCRGRGAVLDGKVSKGHFCLAADSTGNRLRRTPIPAWLSL